MPCVRCHGECGLSQCCSMCMRIIEETQSFASPPLVVDQTAPTTHSLQSSGFQTRANASLDFPTREHVSLDRRDQFPIQMGERKSRKRQPQKGLDQLLQNEKKFPIQASQPYVVLKKKHIIKI